MRPTVADKQMVLARHVRRDVPIRSKSGQGLPGFVLGKVVLDGVCTHFNISPWEHRADPRVCVSKNVHTIIWTVLTFYAKSALFSGCQYLKVRY